MAFQAVAFPALLPASSFIPAPHNESTNRINVSTESIQTGNSQEAYGGNQNPSPVDQDAIMTQDEEEVIGILQSMTGKNLNQVSFSSRLHIFSSFASYIPILSSGPSQYRGVKVMGKESFWGWDPPLVIHDAQIVALFLFDVYSRVKSFAPVPLLYERPQWLGGLLAPRSQQHGVFKAQPFLTPFVSTSFFPFLTKFILLSILFSFLSSAFASPLTFTALSLNINGCSNPLKVNAAVTMIHNENHTCLPFRKQSLLARSQGSSIYQITH